MKIFLPFHIPKLVKSLPFHIPEAWKRHPFRVEPPHIGHYREYPPGLKLEHQVTQAWNIPCHLSRHLSRLSRTRDWVSFRHVKLYFKYMFYVQKENSERKQNITTSTKSAGLYPQYFFYVIARKKVWKILVRNCVLHVKAGTPLQTH